MQHISSAELPGPGGPLGQADGCDRHGDRLAVKPAAAGCQLQTRSRLTVTRRAPGPGSGLLSAAQSQLQ